VVRFGLTGYGCAARSRLIFLLAWGTLAERFNDFVSVERIAAINALGMEMVLRLALDELEKCLEGVDEAYADCQWRTHFGQTNGSELERLEATRSALLLSGQIRELWRRCEGWPFDPLLARRATLLSRRVRWAEIESSPQVYRLRNRIDRAIISFHPQIAAASVSRVERSAVLRRHPDRNRRREAWLATKPLASHIEADLRQLLRQRQNLAWRHGYDDFVSWALDMSGLSHPWIEGFFDELRRLTDAPYRAWLAEVSGRLALPDGLRPWDLAFAAEQGLSLPEGAFPRDGALKAVKAVAKGLGLEEAAEGVWVGVADIPYAALCYGVRPPQDVRVLLGRRNGRAHYDVLFHEFGHALHWRSLRPMSPVMRWESPPFNEAMASLWERLVFEPEWLLDGRVAPDQVTEFQAYQALDGGDLTALFRDIHEEHLGVPYDEIPGWAHNPFWTSHPVYVQNYVIGEAVASQILAALRRRFGRLIDNPQVGAWLAEHCYASGALVPWTDRILRVTGALLGNSDLAADLGC
jgi:hypothetical protein